MRQEFGERIRQVADRNGVSLNELSRRSGMGRTQLSRIVNGTTANPGIRTVVSIARSLGTGVDTLLHGTDIDPREEQYVEEDDQQEGPVPFALYGAAH